VRGAAVVVTAALLAAGLGACGSDSPDEHRGAASTSTTRAGGPTRLTVTGVATRAGTDPVVAPVEIPFSGTLDCRTDPPSGTGAYATSAPDVCDAVAAHADVFAAAGPDPDRICTEIYGGPQHATIAGTVAGEPVDVEIARSDGCGVDDWSRLEFLLGSPER
jgi:hypothetical protein